MDIKTTEDAFAVQGITLQKTKWEIMQYGDKDTSIISFPGEYDVQWVSIKCIDAGDELHYIIHVDDTWTAILQSTAALEKENIDGIDTRYVAGEDIQKELENLELEGEIKLLD